MYNIRPHQSVLNICAVNAVAAVEGRVQNAYAQKIDLLQPPATDHQYMNNKSCAVRKGQRQLAHIVD